MNKSCKPVRILAFVIMLSMILSCAPAFAESYSAAVTAKSMSVYADPTMKQRLGTLDYHTIVVVNATKQNVAQIRYGGATLYAALDELTAVSDIAIAATVNRTTRVYESASTASRSAALKYGVKVYVLAVKGNCAMIEKDGNVGYTYTDCLTKEKTVFDDPDEADSQTSSGDKIAPSKNGVVIDTIKAVVDVASLPVYKSASTGSTKLGTLTLGRTVTVRAYNSSWAYIELNGRYGFCKLASLAKASDTVVVKPEPEKETSKPDLENAIPAVVSADSVKVYKSASTSSTKLGTLNRSAKVNVIAYNSSWAYIELNGNLGYCSVKALSLQEDKPENSVPKEETLSLLGTATVITATAPVYASASTSAKHGTVPIGTCVDVYKHDSTWAYVSLNGTFGYMQIKNLSAKSYADLESGDTSDAVSEMEKALLNLGYFDGVPSSAYDALTTTAVERFQSAVGMTVTGQADESLQRVLFAGNVPESPLLSVSLSKGSVSANVTRIQTRLLNLKYFGNGSSVDGDYGSNTAAAVTLFQSAAGITATGSAGSDTIRAMYNTSAPSLPSGKKAADASSNSGSGSGGTSSNTTSMPASLASSTSSYSASMSNAQKLEYVIYTAQNQLGKRYVYGSAGTSTFDCSGLTRYCFGKIGITLAHSAYSCGYSNTYDKISAISGLIRGDLVFFNTVSDSDLCDHIGIYLGNNSFIHASSGAGKVVVSNLSSGYYNRNFSWGRRVLHT